MDDVTNFYDKFMGFLQDPDTKRQNSGKGLMEEIVGVDYSSLKQTDAAIFTLPPSKVPYDDKPGKCVNPPDAALKQ